MNQFKNFMNKFRKKMRQKKRYVETTERLQIRQHEDRQRAYKEVMTRLNKKREEREEKRTKKRKRKLIIDDDESFEERLNELNENDDS